MLLGDALEQVFEKTGVKALVNMIADDCGCEDRRDALNKFHEKWLAGRGRNNKNHLNIIADTYEAVTGHKVSPKARRSQCPACWQGRIKKIMESPMYKEALLATTSGIDTEAFKKATEQVTPLEELNLKQLREIYPGVKATSKKKFLEIVNHEVV